MKRLIKKSEIYDGFNIANNYYEVFKNPTTSEIEEVKKQNSYNAIRGVILSDGTIYIWSGDILHDNINKNTNEKIDIDQFRFAYEGSSWIIDAHQKYSEEEIYNYLIKYENILSGFGNVNEEFGIYSCTNRRYTKRMLQDIKSTLKESVASRLIKKSEIADGFNDGNKYYEVFKNPTDKEIEEIKKQNSYKSIRGVILSDGTIYSWSGNILHDDINKNANEKIDINQFRFAYEPGEWIIDSHEKHTLPETYDLILKYENILNRFGNLEDELHICYAKKTPGWDTYEDLYLSDLKHNNSENNEEKDYDYNEEEQEKYSKKLVKKSEIADGIKYGEWYYEIFKNPTDDEITIIKKQDGYNSIRGIILEDETIYAWPGNILHNNINKYTTTKIDINQFRFAYDGGRWIIDAHKKYSLKEVIDLTLKYEDILQNIGDINKIFEFYWCSDRNNGEVFNWKEMKEFIKYDFDSEEGII